MSTATLGLQNDRVPGQKIESAKWNEFANAVESVSVNLSEFALGGFLNATDFNWTPGSGLTGTVSAGWLITGATSQRKTVHNGNSQAKTLETNSTNYGFINPDGTCTIVQNILDAPANSKLAFTQVVDGSGVQTTTDNLPSGRQNLLSFMATFVSADDRQAGYLATKLAAGTGITLTVTDDGDDERLTIAVDTSAVVGDRKVKVSSNDASPNFLLAKLLSAHTNGDLAITEDSDGGDENAKFTIAPTAHQVLTDYVFDVAVDTDKLLVLDFSTVGEFDTPGYHVYCTLDGDANDQLVYEIINGKDEHTLKLYIQNAFDAGAGSYGAAGNLKINVWVQGLGWNAAVSPSETDPTLYDFSYGGVGSALNPGSEEISVDGTELNGAVGSHRVVTSSGAGDIEVIMPPSPVDSERHTIIKVGNGGAGSDDVKISANTGQSLNFLGSSFVILDAGLGSNITYEWVDNISRWIPVAYTDISSVPT